jgi:hypothetical protein
MNMSFHYKLYIECDNCGKRYTDAVIYTLKEGQDCVRAVASGLGWTYNRRKKNNLPAGDYCPACTRAAQPVAEPNIYTNIGIVVGSTQWRGAELAIGEALYRASGGGSLMADRAIFHSQDGEVWGYIIYSDNQRPLLATRGTFSMVGEVACVFVRDGDADMPGEVRDTIGNSPLTE